MKSVFVPLALAATLFLGACEHMSEHASASSLSTLSVAEINAQITAIGEEAQMVRQGGDVRAIRENVNYAPTLVPGVDSSGVAFLAFSPGESRDRYAYSFGSSSRPFGYARLEALERRRATLYAELIRRGQTP